jgi:hypothetical protein
MSFFHLYGAISMRKEKETRFLYALLLTHLVVYFAIQAKYILDLGIAANLSYRKPLIGLAPVLAIFGGYGVGRFLNLDQWPILGIKHKRAVLCGIVSILLLFRSGVAYQSYFMRNRYYTQLKGASSWIRTHTGEGAVILSSRSMEIAYLTQRRTLTLTLLAPDSIGLSILEKYNVSHILIPYADSMQMAQLQPYAEQILRLEKNESIEIVYKDEFVVVWEIRETTGY